MPRKMRGYEQPSIRWYGVKDLSKIGCKVVGV